MSVVSSPTTHDRPWRLVVVAPLDPAMIATLVDGLPVEVAVPPTPDAAGLATVLGDAELWVGDWRTATSGMSAGLVALAPRLAFVQQPSVGVQAHDGDVLAAAGVPLANVSGFNAASVAEWALAATVSVAHRLGWAEAELRAGRWPQVEVVERGADEVAGRRVGLLGFGAVGVACATRFAALDCPVSYWSRRRRPPEQEHGTTYRELAELLASSDVLVNALPLTPGTRRLLDAARLATLPPGALLVNASRGGIVDEVAVAEAVASGRLSGAAFDVYETEPLPADSPLRGSDRILLTPHIGGSTRQASARLARAVGANLRRAVTGEPVVDVVNGVDPVVRRRPHPDPSGEGRSA